MIFEEVRLEAFVARDDDAWLLGCGGFEFPSNQILSLPGHSTSYRPVMSLIEGTLSDLKIDVDRHETKHLL